MYMSDKINPFLAAGRTLDRLVSAGSIGDEVARMLHGGPDNKEDMEKRWACTAVLLSDGKMYVYDNEAGWRVKLFADGKLDGRGRWYDAAELANQSTDVWEGAPHFGWSVPSQPLTSITRPQRCSAAALVGETTGEGAPGTPYLPMRGGSKMSFSPRTAFHISLSGTPGRRAIAPM